jgi:hypothetical protein
MTKKPLIAIGVFVLAVGVVVLLILLGRGAPGKAGRDINSVTVQKDGNTLTVNSDGTVSYETDEGTFTDFWDADKTNAFFDYINSKYSGEGDLISGGEDYVLINGQTSYSLGDDELIDTIEDETGGGGGSPPPGGGGSGGLPSPTPTATAGQGGGGDPECLYWRLSYCVRPRTPSPTPSSTPVEVEIREPNCEANTQTGRTVIGNDLCLPTPSPTP